MPEPCRWKRLNAGADVAKAISNASYSYYGFGKESGMGHLGEEREVGQGD
jgi:hypothetical protein